MYLGIYILIGIFVIKGFSEFALNTVFVWRSTHHLTQQVDGAVLQLVSSPTKKVNGGEAIWCP